MITCTVWLPQNPRSPSREKTWHLILNLIAVVSPRLNQNPWPGKLTINILQPHMLKMPLQMTTLKPHMLIMYTHQIYSQQKNIGEISVFPPELLVNCINLFELSKLSLRPLEFWFALTLDNSISFNAKNGVVLG